MNLFRGALIHVNTHLSIQALYESINGFNAIAPGMDNALIARIEKKSTSILCCIAY